MISTCDFRFLCPMKWDEIADLPDPVESLTTFATPRPTRPPP
jgi:hypothetical protein